ncbi:MAG: hypothetical protein U0521_06465 [Anaerolineae bacterium]
MLATSTTTPLSARRFSRFAYASPISSGMIVNGRLHVAALRGWI